MLRQIEDDERASGRTCLTVKAAADLASMFDALHQVENLIDSLADGLSLLRRRPQLGLN
jgi:hypothetical protein